MRRALEIARLGDTSPNPMVGAVIVGPDGVIAEGFHARAGEEHAEPMALRAAGETAVGSTMYVNLEPCAHTGRTPPCVDAIIRSGVSRVVVSMQDPDPLVSGRGIESLRRAGVEVVEGLLRREAEELNRGFIIHRTQGRPMVTLKSALTIDGGTAAIDGSSKWITSEEAREDAHRLRARSDAIAVGVGTVLADDPMLDVRLSDASPRRQPIPVVFDTRLRTLSSAKVVRPGALLFTAAPHGEHEALSQCGAEVISVPEGDGGVEVGACLKVLAERGVLNLLVEGGSQLAASFMRQGMVDRLVLYLAPKILGDGRRLLEGWSAGSIDDAPRFEIVDVMRVGPDLRVTMDPEGG